MAAAPANVTSAADSGPGTLREALASGATNIFIVPSVGNITIDSTLDYAGTAPLSIEGRGQTVTASGDFTVLQSSNGGNLKIKRVNFSGTAGYSFANQGTGKGIFIQVPTDRAGIVRLELESVRVTGVANHGIHISDCELGDACGSGGGGGGDGSPASIQGILNRVVVNDAGNGKFDADGVRFDERNVGDIILQVSSSEFSDVGADGIELDEGQGGDIFVEASNSFFDSNGAYCLGVPEPLDVNEPCVEDDDGELVLDLDDGFDIDEAGDGSILGSFDSLFVMSNLDEGLDFDEEDNGGMDLEYRFIFGENNGDEAIKMSAAGAGDVIAEMRFVNALMNGNDGIEAEVEDGDGEVHLDFRNGTSRGNDGDGIQASQENTTNPGTQKLRGFTDVDSLDLENVVER